MTAEEFLSRIETYDTLIDGKLNERQKLWCLATRMTASFDREAVQKSGLSDKVGEIGTKLAYIEREIDEVIDTYIDIQNECIEVIEMLAGKPLYYKVIHMHFVDYVSYADIAKSLHYSYTWIMEIKDRALAEVEKIINFDEKIQALEKSIKEKYVSS